MPLSTAKSPATAREKMLWGTIGALAVAQLIALWMLCSHQVEQAQLRGATKPARMAQQHDPLALEAATENTASLSASAYRPTRVNFQPH